MIWYRGNHLIVRDDRIRSTIIINRYSYQVASHKSLKPSLSSQTYMKDSILIAILCHLHSKSNFSSIIFVDLLIVIIMINSREERQVDVSSVSKMITLLITIGIIK